MRHYPIVWKPFTAGLMIGLAPRTRTPVPNIKPISFDPAIAARSLAIMEKALNAAGEKVSAGAPVSEVRLKEKVVDQMAAGGAANWAVVVTQDVCAYA